MSVVALNAGTPYTSAKQLTPGATVAAGSGVCIAANAPGPVTLIMSDGSTLTVFAALGTMVLAGLSVQGVKSGAEAYATVFVLN